MATMSMNVREGTDGRFAVIFYCDDSDFDGNDFSKSYIFESADTALLAEKLDTEVDAEKLKAAIEKKFDRNMYDTGFEKFCIANGIHAEWTLKEDCPAGICETGSF